MKVVEFQTYQPVRIAGKVESHFSINRSNQVMNGLKINMEDGVGIRLELQGKKFLISYANIAYIQYEDAEKESKVKANEKK